MASTQRVKKGSTREQIACYPNVYNHTQTDMALLDSHAWSGFFSNLHDTISAGGMTSFSNAANGSDQGSMGGVKYSVTNAAGVERGVVVAWIAPADLNPPYTPNQVYVQCGSKADIEALTWDSILEALRISNESSLSNDTAGSISATGIIGPSPDSATGADVDAHLRFIP